ncbi:MAG: glycine cleavage system protein H [Planctomycetota bacterium]
MGHVQNRIAQGLIIAFFALALVVGLPLLAPLAFTLRGALLVVVVAVVVGGGVAYILSQGFRDWFAAHTEPQVKYKGLRFSNDVAFHPSHSWALMNDAVVVGVDDVVQATLGPVDEVNLPPAGCRVRRGDQLFRLRRGDRTIGVRSPVSGTVLARNEALHGRPQLVNEEPFAKGWAVRLRPEDPQDRRSLLRGGKARAWFHTEVDRVIGILMAEGSATPVLPDGGVVVAEVYRHINDEAWDRLTETMFARQRE